MRLGVELVVVAAFAAAVFLREVLREEVLGVTRGALRTQHALLGLADGLALAAVHGELGLQFAVQVGGFVHAGGFVIQFWRDVTEAWLFLVGAGETARAVAAAALEVALRALNDFLNVDGPLRVGLCAGRAGQRLLRELFGKICGFRCVIKRGSMVLVH